MARTTAAVVDLDDPALYVNRELALLAFQERVLEQVEDVRTPLLERAKFLAILSSNIAEFYMVRVAGLRQQVDAGVRDLSDDGLTPAEQLTAVRAECARLMARARHAFRDLRAALAGEGIHMLDYAALDEEACAVADEFFVRRAFPVLTPLAFDPGRPFPHISNLSMNLAVVVRGPDGVDRFARVKMPKSLPRLVPVSAAPSAGDGHGRPSRDQRFVWLEQLVTAHVGRLFPGLEVVEAHAFRITRDAEMEIQELEADDLIESVEKGVRQRRFGSVVRMTVDTAMPAHIRDILIANLGIGPDDVVTLEPPLGMSELFQLYALDRPDLKYPSFLPAASVDLQTDEGRDIFSVIREKDVLLHHPFDSFEPIVAFLRQAARDPDVLAIKMTLYRVGKDSPVVEALLDAAQRGKEVACLVELKARFDEESNIEWARALEREGVHVVYGLLGLKTHSKVVLVVRREGTNIRRYVHVGTGNYNVVTATQYTDLGMLTCDARVGADASELFNLITGYVRTPSFKRFLVAPVNLRAGIERLVRREIEHAKAGRDARIIMKMNSLVDRRMVRLLYEASQAGVRIDLLVRGICCLRPGIAGLSETVRVTSVVGRFLEHSRVFWFDNAGEPAVLIGSADLMVRNLDRRVEVLAPVTDPTLVARLRSEVLETYMADNVTSRVMSSDGTYVRSAPAEGEKPVDAQQACIVARQKSAAGRPEKRKRRSRKPVMTGE